MKINIRELIQKQKYYDQILNYYYKEYFNNNLSGKKPKEMRNAQKKLNKINKQLNLIIKS